MPRMVFVSFAPGRLRDPIWTEDDMQIYTIPGGGNYDLFSKKMVKMHEGIYASDVCRSFLLSR